MLRGICDAGNIIQVFLLIFLITFFSIMKVAKVQILHRAQIVVVCPSKRQHVKA